MEVEIDIDVAKHILLVPVHTYLVLVVVVEEDKGNTLEEDDWDDVEVDKDDNHKVVEDDYHKEEDMVKDILQDEMDNLLDHH